MKDRLIWATVGLVALVAASPTLVCLMRTALPVVVLLGVVVAVLRVVWFLTRGW